jgi:nucleoside-diphosphate-sugar epimerase
LTELGAPDVVIDVNPGIGKAGHGVLHFAGRAARAVVLTSMDVYRAMSVLWGVEDEPQAMPVTEDAELRSGPSPDLGDDLAFDNLEVEASAARAPFPVTVVRCPVIYGPLDSQRRLRDYVRAMTEGRARIAVPRLRLSRGYVEDVAAAVVATASDERAAGRTYNVAEPDALSEAEWAGAIGDTFGWRGEVVEEGPRLQDLYGDTSRIRAELGYAERVGRAEGLRRAVEWEVGVAGDAGHP